jgi:hypothetical protein
MHQIHVDFKKANFVRHQMSLSAAKALGGDHTQYAGLGDCFVLTCPAKADSEGPSECS